ncbi:TPA: hypothetical protein ACHT43_000914, partial [Klebsiella variicola]
VKFGFIEFERKTKFKPVPLNLMLKTAALYQVTRALSPTQNQKSMACFIWKIKHYRSHFAEWLR